VRLPRGSTVVLGIGDDCAIFRPRGCNEDLLFTTDLLIDDVHFRRETHPPRAVGHKALARGLSDIAAMGGEPRFCLLSLALPPWATTRWVDAFYDGLLAFGVPLAGGDLAHADRLAADIVVCGSVPRGKALRRDGAKPGDVIYVSGELGGPSSKGFRDLYPQPRLDLGRFLRGRASAAMDLSDGLSLDLHRLCAASRVSAEIAGPPLSPGASLENALHGGEDYELLFTAPAGVPIPKAHRGVRLSAIGAIRRGKPGRITLDGKPLPPLGYDHLKRS